MLTAILQSIFYYSVIVNTHTHQNPTALLASTETLLPTPDVKTFRQKKDNHDHSDKKYTIVLHIIQAKTKNQAKELFFK